MVAKGLGKRALAVGSWVATLVALTSAPAWAERLAANPPVSTPSGAPAAPWGGAGGATEQPATDPTPPANPRVERIPTEAPVVPYGVVPDPASTHVFALPTARLLVPGDMMATLGAVTPNVAGLRIGVTRRFDVGVSVPLYLVGLAVDARYALVQRQGFALAAVGYVTAPVLPGSDPAQFLGFTYAGAGPAWNVGPVATFWGARASFTIGISLAQRAMLLGLWGMTQVSLDVRILDGVRALAGVVVLGELVPENAMGTRAATLVGNLHPRILPYVVVGVRLHARRFAVDLGPLVAVGTATPLSTGVVGVWPWLAAAYLF